MSTIETVGAPMLRVRVARRTDEAADIVSLELRHEDGARLPPFGPGAHIDLHIGAGLVRPYSLCNDPQETDRYLIAVLREPNSRGGSLAVHQSLRVGDTVSISEPKNNFALVENEPALLLAGGIGITPILCMAQHLWRTAVPFAMHYCVRTREKAAFIEQIAAAPYADRAQLHFDDGPAAQKLQAAQILRSAPARSHLYVCGPSGFIAHVRATAEDQAWPADKFHLEYFANTPAQADTAAGDRPFDVRIASTGMTVKVGADEPVTAALARHGIQVPVACEQGVCGTCVTRVLEGQPEHRDIYFTKAEQARNDQFTPCCSRARSALLVLDV